MSHQCRSPEKLGYPTQKPVALLERIVAASSNPGDVVLDPFCGCGTTVHAAQKLGRQWIGIDVTHLAIGLIEKRLRDAFPGVTFTTHGTPQDLSGARDLAARGRTDKNYYFEFEKWALSLIAAQPGNLSKKGADHGIDGNVWFGKTSRAIVSVKAGDNVSVAHDPRPARRHRAREGRHRHLPHPHAPDPADAGGSRRRRPVRRGRLRPGPPRADRHHRGRAAPARPRRPAPARRDDAFKRAAREEAPERQGKLGL